MSRTIIDKALIRVIAELQKIQTESTAAYIPSLPRVVVVGPQSAGKSSVLESISGFDFLPKGIDTVTRRPTLIELKQCGQQEQRRVVVIDHYAKNQAKKRQEFGEDDFNTGAISRCIRQANDDHCPLKTDIKSDQIIVEIHSPDVLDLTLVDLPGLVTDTDDADKVMMKRKIDDMVRTEIEKPSTIILVVHIATVDMQTNPALSMAKQVRNSLRHDPNPPMIVGVVTRCDEMNDIDGKVARYKSYGILAPMDAEQLQDGIRWIPVRNRNLTEIKQGKTIQEVRDVDERLFFLQEKKVTEASAVGENVGFAAATNESGIAAGVPYLIDFLAGELSRRALQQFPIIKSRLKTSLKELGQDVGRLLYAQDKAMFAKGARKFTELFVRALERELDGRTLGSKALTMDLAGKQLDDIYTGDFLHKMERLDPCADLTDTAIDRAIANAAGHDSKIYLSMRPLQVLLRRLITTTVKDICLECVTAAKASLTSNAKRIAEGDIAAPNQALRTWIHETSEAIIESFTEDCMDHVAKAVTMEWRVNTRHPQYPKVNELKESIQAGVDGDSASVLTNQADSDGTGSDGSTKGTVQIVYKGSNTTFIENEFDFAKLDFQNVVLKRNHSRAPSDNDYVLLFQKSGDGAFAAYCMGKDFADYLERLTALQQVHERKQRTVGQSSTATLARSSEAVSIENNWVRRELTKQQYIKYFDDILRIKIIDTVPKAITALIVNKLVGDDDDEGDEPSFSHLLNEELSTVLDPSNPELDRLMRVSEQDKQHLEQKQTALEKIKVALASLEQYYHERA